MRILFFISMSLVVCSVALAAWVRPADFFITNDEYLMLVLTNTARSNPASFRTYYGEKKGLIPAEQLALPHLLYDNYVAGARKRAEKASHKLSHDGWVNDMKPYVGNDLYSENLAAGGGGDSWGAVDAWLRSYQKLSPTGHRGHIIGGGAHKIGLSTHVRLEPAGNGSYNSVFGGAAVLSASGPNYGNGPLITAAAVRPRISWASVERTLYLNYYDPKGNKPKSISARVGGVCIPMYLDEGAPHYGTYTAKVKPPEGCNTLSFEAITDFDDVLYFPKEQKSFLVGSSVQCEESREIIQRPQPCGINPAKTVAKPVMPITDVGNSGQPFDNFLFRINYFPKDFQSPKSVSLLFPDKCYPLERQMNGNVASYGTYGGHIPLKESDFPAEVIYDQTRFPGRYISFAYEVVNASGEVERFPSSGFYVLESRGYAYMWVPLQGKPNPKAPMSRCNNPLPLPPPPAPDKPSELTVSDKTVTLKIGETKTVSVSFINRGNDNQVQLFQTLYANADGKPAQGVHAKVKDSSGNELIMPYSFLLEPNAKSDFLVEITVTNAQGLKPQYIYAITANTRVPRPDGTFGTNSIGNWFYVNIDGVSGSGSGSGSGNENPYPTGATIDPDVKNVLPGQNIVLKARVQSPSPKKGNNNAIVFVELVKVEKLVGNQWQEANYRPLRYSRNRGPDATGLITVSNIRMPNKSKVRFPGRYTFEAYATVKTSPNNRVTSEKITFTLIIQ